MDILGIKSEYGSIIIGLLLFTFIMLTVLSVLSIWAVNTLFEMNIPITAHTVFAAMVLVLIVGGAKFSLKQDTTF